MTIKIWILLYLLVLFTKLVTGAADVEVTSHYVADQYCLRLYHLQESVQWDQAYTQCIIKGMELLSISDHNKQLQVETLLKSVTMPDELQKYIWMSGKKSHNVTWTSIDLNNKFHGTSNIIEGNGSYVDEENCLTGKFHRDGQSAIFNTVQCSKLMSAVKLICQWSTTIQECYTDTTHDQHYRNGVCYMFVDAGDRDWFSAQRQCQMRYGGDIFLNLPVTYADIGPMTQWISPGETMWIGAWRRPWKWISESKNVPMRYFNWESGAGGEVTTDVTMCTVLHGDSGQWKDISCSTPCQYIICEGPYSDHNLSTSTTATSYPTTTTTTSLTTTTVPTEFHNWTAHFISKTMDKNEAVFEPVYIAAIAAGVIVVVIVVLAVILVRCRRKMTNQTETAHVNTDTPATNTPERDYASLATPHLTTIPNNVYDHLGNQTTTGDDIQAADYYNLPASDQLVGREQLQSVYDGLNDVTSTGNAENMVQGDGHYENLHDEIPGTVEQLQRPYGNITYIGDYEVV